MGEDKVSSFARLVAGEAGFESCLGQVRKRVFKDV
jgi:hypothetical protein